MDQKRLTDVLIEFARNMAAGHPTQGILDRLVRCTLDVVPVSGAGVLLLDKDLDLRFVAASDEILLRIEGLQLSFGQGPCIEAFHSGRQVLVPDLGRDERFPHFSPRAKAAGLGAVFSFPMAIDEVPIGALDVYQREPQQLDGPDVAACQVLADVAASYVENSGAHQAARELAEALQAKTMHDILTGLPNRLLLQDRLAVAVAKGWRTGAVVAVLFVDLDRFKSINDAHGHQVGDDLLVSVAQRLRQAVRPGDTVARLGGDEFVIVCEEMHDSVEAEEVARRVAFVLAQPYDIAPVGEVTVTASVGIAFAGKTISLPEVILRDADAAMYQAKEGGGARYVVIDKAVHAQR